MFSKLQKILKEKREIDQNQEWYSWAKVYFDALREEIYEVEEEIKENNSVYLEDELWDILWTSLNLIEWLKEEWKIWWLENVLKRAEKKYSERIDTIKKSNWKSKDYWWKDMKIKQKQELKKEHEEKYKK